MYGGFYLSRYWVDPNIKITLSALENLHNYPSLSKGEEASGNSSQLKTRNVYFHPPACRRMEVVFLSLIRKGKMAGGYMGKILFVDLSTGRLKKKPSMRSCAVTLLTAMGFARGCYISRQKAGADPLGVTNHLGSTLSFHCRVAMAPRLPDESPHPAAQRHALDRPGLTQISSIWPECVLWPFSL